MFKLDKEIYTMLLSMFMALSLFAGNGPKVFEPPVISEPVVVQVEKCCGAKCKCAEGACKCEKPGDCLVKAKAPKDLEPLTYVEGSKLAKEKGQKLITYVGVNGKALEKFEGYVVCQAKSLEGFADGDKVTSHWVYGEHLMISVDGPSKVTYTPAPTFTYSIPTYQSTCPTCQNYRSR